MYYRPKNPKKYAEVLTQFIDKENPPEHIFLYEIRDRETIMHILDMFPRSKFYIVDEPHFIRLLLKWPKKNYSERILAYEMLKTTDPEDDKKDPSVEELISPLEAILKKVEVNDLIVIMNPPYGYQNTLVKPIIQKIFEFDKIFETICLAPANAFKESMNHVSKFVKVDNLFEKVTIENLVVTKLLFNEINKFSFEDCVLEEDELLLFQAIQKYNSFKEIFCFPIRSGMDLNQRYFFSLKNCFKVPENFKNFENKSLEQLGKENCIFYTTTWTPFDGVHVSENCWDYKLNILNEVYPKDKLKFTPTNFLIFKNKESRDNFRDWWYSCKNTIEKGKNKRIGLTNKMLKLIVKSLGGGQGGPAYLTCFPNLDWSRSWTDEEIIQELKDKAGLPKDWVLKTL